MGTPKTMWDPCSDRAWWDNVNRFRFHLHLSLLASSGIRQGSEFNEDTVKLVDPLEVLVLDLELLHEESKPLDLIVLWDKTEIFDEALHSVQTYNDTYSPMLVVVQMRKYLEVWVWITNT